jgi:DNA (cytosine-5)-methyltransferase 1|tara:strand:- start:1011 stop:2342 length:1332 start_codon:yes stop_codon:yes gene_type:complete
MTEIKYVDFCAGIGGFRYAIDAYQNSRTDIKFKCVLTADIKKHAIDTYNLNFNENNPLRDIYELKPETMETFDLLCAGFPCQPFSSAGQKKGFEDHRGGMIFKILDICKFHKPRYVLLENVHNLISLDDGKYIKSIYDLFSELGYNVEYTMLNSKNYGIPQSRERVYIICTLNKKIDISPLNDLVSSPQLKNFLDYTDTTSDLNKVFVDKLLKLHKKQSIEGCKIGDKRGGEKNIHSWDLGLNGEITDDERKLMTSIMLERRKKHWAKKKNITWMDGMPLTFPEIQSFFKHDELQSLLDSLTEKKYLRLEQCKELVNGKRIYIKDLMSAIKSDQKEELVRARALIESDTAIPGYNICKGKLSFPVSKILDSNDICPTLTATDSNRLAVVIGGTVVRKLNHLELKRVCGFPETLKLPNDVNVYDLFGNMATPPVLYKLIELMFE